MSMTEIDAMVKELGHEAINYKGGLNVMDFVDDCYLKTTYLKTYENLILPMNGMDMWDKSDFPPCLPPSYSKQPGRPRKCRNKEQEKHKGKMKMKMRATNLKLHCPAFPTHRTLSNVGNVVKKDTIRGLAIGIFPQKPNLQLRGRGVLKIPRPLHLTHPL
ncbi:unnamed protein product [Prunus brigantina]